MQDAAAEATRRAKFKIDSANQIRDFEERRSKAETDCYTVVAIKPRHDSQNYWCRVERDYVPQHYITLPDERGKAKLHLIPSIRERDGVKFIKNIFSKSFAVRWETGKKFDVHSCTDSYIFTVDEKCLNHDTCNLQELMSTFNPEHRNTCITITKVICAYATGLDYDATYFYNGYQHYFLYRPTMYRRYFYNILLHLYTPH